MPITATSREFREAGTAQHGDQSTMRHRNTRKELKGCSSDARNERTAAGVLSSVPNRT